MRFRKIWKIKRPPAARPGEINYGFVDRFTFVHFGLGVLYGTTGLSFGVTFLLAIVWELAENPLKAYATFLFPHATADTWKNACGDIMAVCAGWFLFSGIF